jgi:hypothetical protein
MFCLYCAMTFMNAASRIIVVYDNGNRDYIHERGLQAIRGAAQLLEDNPGSYLELNAINVRSQLRCETMVSGNAVCMDHAHDAIENDRRRPMNRW